MVHIPVGMLVHIVHKWIKLSKPNFSTCFDFDELTGNLRLSVLLTVENVVLISLCYW